MYSVPTGFDSLKKGDFDTEDKDSRKRAKMRNWKFYSIEDSGQTQEELTESLNVHLSTIFRSSKGIGMIRKQGNRVEFELKPSDIERPKNDLCNIFSKTQKKRFFASYHER